MDIRIEVGNFEDAAVVRQAVFMDEQGYEDEFEPLDDDPRCLHVTLYADGELAACGRTFPEALEHELTPNKPQSPTCALDAIAEVGETYIIGRVAVLPSQRRHGLATRVIEACDAAAREQGAKLIKLHAQKYVQGLYASCGYEPISPVDYEDEGQPHLWMAKAL